MVTSLWGGVTSCGRTTYHSLESLPLITFCNHSLYPLSTIKTDGKQLPPEFELSSSISLHYHCSFTTLFTGHSHSIITHASFVRHTCITHESPSQSSVSHQSVTGHSSLIHHYFITHSAHIQHTFSTHSQYSFFSHSPLIQHSVLTQSSLSQHTHSSLILCRGFMTSWLCTYHLYWNWNPGQRALWGASGGCRTGTGGSGSGIRSGTAGSGGGRSIHFNMAWINGPKDSPNGCKNSSSLASPSNARTATCNENKLRVGEQGRPLIVRE
jgi:hypothetical protein